MELRGGREHPIPEVEIPSSGEPTLGNQPTGEGDSSSQEVANPVTKPAEPNKPLPAAAENIPELSGQAGDQLVQAETPSGIEDEMAKLFGTNMTDGN